MKIVINVYPIITALTLTYFPIKKVERALKIPIVIDWIRKGSFLWHLRYVAHIFIILLKIIVIDKIDDNQSGRNLLYKGS